MNATAAVSTTQEAVRAGISLLKIPLARQKTNADIVTELIRNVDAATAKKNLQVAIGVDATQSEVSAQA